MTDKDFYPHVPNDHIIKFAGESRLWQSRNNPENWTLQLVWHNIGVDNIEETKKELMRWSGEYFQPKFIFKDTNFTHINLPTKSDPDQTLTTFRFHFKEHEDFKVEDVI